MTDNNNVFSTLKKQLLRRVRRHMSTALGVMDGALDEGRRQPLDVERKASHQVALASACAGQLDPHAVSLAARTGFTLKALAELGCGIESPDATALRQAAEVLPDPNGSPPDPTASAKVARKIGAVAKAQDLLAAAAAAVEAVAEPHLLAMLRDVASRAIQDLAERLGLASRPDAIEAQAREFIGLYLQGEPPTPILRLALAHAHVREAADLCVRAGTWEWNPYREADALLHRLGDVTRAVIREQAQPQATAE